MLFDWTGLAHKKTTALASLPKNDRQLVLQIAQQQAPLLPVALEEGQDELVGLLLKAQISRNPLALKDSQGDPLLHQTARHGDYPKAVEKVLKGKPDLALTDKQGNTALHVAIEKHHNKAFDLLLNEVIETDYASVEARPAARDALSLINAPNKQGETPLVMAAKMGNTYAAHQLLNKGANPNVQDADGNTPLMWAAKNYHATMIKKLLKHGALGNTVNKQGETSYIQFLKSKANPDLSSQTVWLAHTPVLIHRVLTGDHRLTFPAQIEAIQLLKIVSPPFSEEQAKALVETWWLNKPVANEWDSVRVYCTQSLAFQHNATDEQGRTLAMRLLKQLQTPLAPAEAKLKEKRLLKLISRSVNINQQDNEGKTLLMHLLETDNPLKWIMGPIVVRSLIEQNPLLNVQLTDRNGNGGLHYLAAAKNTEDRLNFRSRVIRKMIVMGTSVKPSWHREVMNLLPSDNLFEILTANFLKMGFNPLLVNNRLETAAMVAAQKGNQPVLKVMIEKCPNILNKEDITGKTALIHAVLNNQTEVIQQLCEAEGIDKTITDHQGKTAHDYALEVGLPHKICSQLKPE